MFRDCDDISITGKILGNLIIKDVEKYGLWNALRKECIRSANSSLGRWKLFPIYMLSYVILNHSRKGHISSARAFCIRRELYMRYLDIRPRTSFWYHSRRQYKFGVRITDSLVKTKIFLRWICSTFICIHFSSHAIYGDTFPLCPLILWEHITMGQI